jgi:hypothetical protein
MMSFMRHSRQEYGLKKERATFKSNTFIIFKSVELFLSGLLSSSARIRFTQHNKDIFSLTQFIEHSPVSQNVQLVRQML